MALIKQSAAYVRMFKMISSADHLSPKTGANPVVSLGKAGGALGAASGAVAEISNGWYKVSLVAADTGTLGDLAYFITGSGADDTDFVDQVVAFDPNDAVTLGLAPLAELPQALPPVNPRFDQALMLLYMALRNRVDVDASNKKVYNDAGAVIAKKALTDDGTTYAEAKAVAGP